MFDIVRREEVNKLDIFNELCRSY